MNRNLIVFHKIFLATSIFLISSVSIAIADESQPTKFPDFEETTELVKILTNGVENADYDVATLRKFRLKLFERLAIVPDEPPNDKEETLQALHVLFPTDSLIKLIAEKEGVSLSLNNSSPNEGVSKVAAAKPKKTTPKLFEIALEEKNAKELVRLLTTVEYANRVASSDREKAKEIIVNHVRPLPASNAQGNHDSYRALSILEPSNPQFIEKKKHYANAIKSKRNAIVRRMKKSKDDFNGNVFYKHPNTPRYTDTRTYLSVYLGQNGDRVWLRMVLNYTANSWLFVKSASLNIDGEIIRLPFTNWERDNDSEIWEWVDVSLNSELRGILKKVANSKSTIVRFNGSKYYDNKTIREKDKQVIRDMFLLENVLKEN